MRLITTFCGIELARAEVDTASLAGRIQPLVARHGLVIIKNAVRTQREFAILAGKLGTVVSQPHLPEVEPGSGVSRVAHAVTPDELRRTDAKIYASGWHADMTFLSNPPSISLLWCETAPDAGGDTLWCDTEQALSTLSESLQRFLLQLTARHSDARSYAPTGNYRTRPVVGVTLTAEKPEIQANHPVIGKSSCSDRQCILVNPGYTTGINELTPAESDMVLRHLYQTMFVDESLVRVRWESAMLVVWDNMRLLHRALNQGIFGNRTMLRANVVSQTLGGKGPALSL